MTAFSNIIADPSFLVMYAIAFILLYLGIKKHYEPLLLVPIAFGVLIANFPGGDMGVIQALMRTVTRMFTLLQSQSPVILLTIG